MEITGHRQGIHLVLKDLIEMKSKRDRSNFSLSQLAKAIDMPHSILSKLTHDNPARRVSNPRVETLTKIVDFFKHDGFDVTVDNLLRGLEHKAVIPVQEQIAVPLYFLDSELNHRIGTVEVDMIADPKNLIALVSDEYIEPMFKKGSVFVVNTQSKPEHGTLVAVLWPGHEKIMIRKFYVDGHKHILKLHDNDYDGLVLMPTVKYKIIGVVTQVNART